MLLKTANSGPPTDTIWCSNPEKGGPRGSPKESRNHQPEVRLGVALLRMEKACVEREVGWDQLREFQRIDVMLLEGLRCSVASHDGCQRSRKFFLENRVASQDLRPNDRHTPPPWDGCGGAFGAARIRNRASATRTNCFRGRTNFVCPARCHDPLEQMSGHSNVAAGVFARNCPIQTLESCLVLLHPAAHVKRYPSTGQMFGGCDPMHTVRCVHSELVS